MPLWCGVVGVAGWNTILLLVRTVRCDAGGLAHCWVLRRHPCCGVFLVPLLLGLPSALLIGVVVAGWWGVVVC